MLSKRLLLLFIMIASVLTVGLNHAIAVPITGNETQVTLTSFDFLRNNGFSVDTTGTAVLDADTDPFGRPVVTFPITGGDTQGPNGGAIIEHEGSGLSLSRNLSTLLLDDFVIDKGNDTLSGAATIQGTGAAPITQEDVVLFDLSGCNQFTLLNLSQAGSNAFSQAFGTPDLTGILFGFATVDLQTAQAVPEPSTLLLLGAGILGLLGFRKVK